jgi:DNA-directed RNA polymerase subunit M/transcription elongation factor TFIIS
MAEELEQETGPTKPQFPVACPHCTAPSGYPYQVQTRRDKLDRVNVSVRCKDCDHTWMVERLGVLTPAPQ